MGQWCRRIMVLAAVAASAAAPALAADAAAGESWQELVMSPNGAHEVSINLGGFHPTSRFGFRGIAGDRSERFGSNGFYGTVDYLMRVNAPLAVGGEFGYVNRDAQSVTNVTIGTPSSTRVRGDSLLLLALARLRMPGFGWRPYVVGGAGFHRTVFDLYGSVPGLTDNPIIRGNETNYALVGRAGLEYANKRGGFIGFEAGYLHTAAMHIQPTATAAALGYQNVTVTGDGVSYSVKLGVRFGDGP